MSVAAVTARISKEDMGGTSIKKQRLSYSVMFKLAAVCYAETYGNRATARYLGVNEKQIRDWKSKKHDLIHCDSGAKRLKGAARHRNRNKIPATEIRDVDLRGSESRDLRQHQFKTSANEEGKIPFWPFVFDIAKTELPTQQLYDGSWHHETNDFIASNAISGRRKFKEANKELDFHERFSCALALLDLKASHG